MRLVSLQSKDAGTGAVREYSFACPKRQECVQPSAEVKETLLRLLGGALVNPSEEISAVFADGEETYRLFRSSVDFEISAGDLLLADGEQAEEWWRGFCGSPQEFLNGCYLSWEEFLAFRKAPQASFFPEVATLQSLAASAKETSGVWQSEWEDARKKVSEITSGEMELVSAQQMRLATQEWYEHQAELEEKQRAYADLSEQAAEAALAAQWFDLYRQSAQKLKQLQANEATMAAGRLKVAEHDNIEAAFPKLKRMAELKQSLREVSVRLKELQQEYEFLSGEKKDCEQLIAEKLQEMEALNEQMRLTDWRTAEEDLPQLRRETEQLHEDLRTLQQQMDDVSQKRLSVNDRIAEVEKTVGDIKQHLEEMEAPAKSVGELLEIVRLGAKMKEIEAQLEKANSDLLIKESQLAEKQLAVTEAGEKLKQILNLDKLVTPLKSKENYTKFIEAKLKKLERINASLAEKEHNLEAALEKYVFGELEVSNSLECLQTALIQKEFNRDNLRTSNAVAERWNQLKVGDYCPICGTQIAQQPSFSVTNVENLEADIEETKSSIFRRTQKLQDVIAKKATLQGALKEIRRNIEINNSESSELRKELNKITQRFSELVKTNESEQMQNYFKALDANNATTFLLEMQKDAVRQETEEREMRRSIDQLKTKIYELNSRLNYLNETYDQLDRDRSSLDLVVETNEQMKSELLDIGERLSGNYAKHLALVQSASELDAKLLGLQNTMQEKMQKLHYNEDVLHAAEEKGAERQSQGSLAQAKQHLKEELTQTRLHAEETEAALLQNRVTRERLGVQAAQKMEEFRLLKEESKPLLRKLGSKAEWFDKIAQKSDTEEIEALRQGVLRYDRTVEVLKTQTATLGMQLREKSVSPEQAEAVRQRKAEMAQSLEEGKRLVAASGEKVQTLLAQQQYSDRVKLQLAQAAGGLEQVQKMQEVLQQSQVSQAVLEQRIRVILKQADVYLRQMTDRALSLSYDGELTLQRGAEKVSFSALDEWTQYLVYAAMRFSLENGLQTLNLVLFDPATPFENEKLSELAQSVRKNTLCFGEQKGENSL